MMCSCHAVTYAPGVSTCDVVTSAMKYIYIYFFNCLIILIFYLLQARDVNYLSFYYFQMLTGYFLCHSDELG